LLPFYLGHCDPWYRISLGLGEGGFFFLEATMLNQEIRIGQPVEGTVCNADWWNRMYYWTVQPWVASKPLKPRTA
jgi:hypothetical protein